MPKLPPLYLITDRHQIVEGRRFLDVIEELLHAGVRLLQLREKDLTAAELLPLARDIRTLTRRHGCKLLLNDRVDVALAIGADGVHLGGHSLPPTVVRSLLGPEKLIGVSTHNLQEIAIAAEQSADFVTFGPVFFTPSKAAYGEPVGLQKLHSACAEAALPVYGLGGIKPNNCAEVVRAGAHGVALISALLSATSPTKAYQKLFSSLN